MAGGSSKHLKRRLTISGTPHYTTRIARKRVRPMFIRPSVPIVPVTVQEEALCDSIPKDEIYIVAGGPSLKKFNFNTLAHKCTLVINKSIFSVPNPNYFITVDYTFFSKINKAKFNLVPAKKFFVADFSFPALKLVKGQVVDTRFNLVYDLSGIDILIQAKCRLGIGYDIKDFTTGLNSGFCALQLAILLGFKKIYLLGLDLNSHKATHYHEGYGESVSSFNTKLELYYGYFEVALSQLKQDKPDIEVISCSKSSRLNNLISYKYIEDFS